MLQSSLLALCSICCVLLVTPAVGVRPIQSKNVIPAGTIIYCTLDEPNFSSKTAVVGDPVLCNLGPLRSFGHSVFPRGAQLSGHLEDYKNPGHFVGKGSLSIEFDRIILPNAEILPITAKIISAPHQKVDAQGVIRGKGHPKRDAALWAVPVFWPIKICTLPARGPFPTLKGESRLGLRLMEDLELPLPEVTTTFVPGLPRIKPSSSSSSTEFRPMPTAISKNVNALTFRSPTEPITDSFTVIALQKGTTVLARDYWIEGATLHCVLANGAEQDFPIAALDVVLTLKLNQAHNGALSLHSKSVLEQ